MDDGLYLVYVKDGLLYSVILNQEQWEMLQLLGETITGNPVKLYDKPLGKAENGRNMKGDE